MKSGGTERHSGHQERRLPRRAFGTLGAIVLGAWLGYLLYFPVIRSIPVVGPDEPVVIRGKHFGALQGNGCVVFGEGSAVEAVRNVEAWSKDRIVVRVPECAKDGGHIRVVRHLAFVDVPSKPAAFVVKLEGLPSRPYGYEVPTPPESPWPLFRRDHRNTGRSPFRAAYAGDQPWSFRTGKGVFSTPVVDADGAIYVGGADHVFYAINADGTEKWRFQTGGIIDSAAAIHRADPQTGAEAVTMISGDGLMYHLRTDGPLPNAADRVLWTFDASNHPGAGYSNWWEGNVALGFDGTLYAGNTNWNYYAINPDGALKWYYPTGNNNWSMAALGDDGTIYWGALDTRVHAVAPDGRRKWTKRTLGFVAASAAIGTDGTIYIGSFDRRLYALDPSSGKTKWSFQTQDHIYGSAALGVDTAGNNSAVYFGSTDGIFYAVSAHGDLLWTYDTGDPIRSSPALGRAPEGEPGDVVYFGSGNGVLYALNAADGTRRWSIDTTPDDPELKDRNDLNASVALGKTGVYVAGEHGYAWYVPYDYPLHATDLRGKTDPGEDIPPDVSAMYYVTAGGTTLWQAPDTIPSAAILTFRLVVRIEGRTVDARLFPKGLFVNVDPPFGFKQEISADGRYVHVIPDGFLDPGKTVTIRFDGTYCTGGIHLGNLTLSGQTSGSFASTFTFRASQSGASKLPLEVGPDKVTALEWTRLAVPMPSMMPSLNQIGFDSWDCILSPVYVSPPNEQNSGICILWLTQARRNADGVLVADPNPEFSIPLNGLYQGDRLLLRNHDFRLCAMNLEIPFDVFEMRGQLGTDGIVQPGATVYAETPALSIPTYGPYLVLAGLANHVYEKVMVKGTFITRPYDERGTADKRPQGVTVPAASYMPPTQYLPGQASVTIFVPPGIRYALTEHHPAILLTDQDRQEAIFLDYRGNTTATPDAQGNIETITLALPAGTQLPPRTGLTLILDAFPIYNTSLDTVFQMPPRSPGPKEG